ncbi:MAG TPA: heavy-metal-associated domain-containing protein [Ruminiclostridium sp.]|nr:heavy-metal-associated domain-containing protein [Ruminiclostridium sp.]
MSKQSAYFRVPELTGNHGEKELKRAVGAIPGVISVSVNTSTNKAAVDYDSTGTSAEKIKEEIEKSGYTAQLIAREDHTM